jgi:hypothetical protein
MKPGGLLRRVDATVIRRSIFAEMGYAPVPGVSAVQAAADGRCLPPSPATVLPAHAAFFLDPASVNTGMVGRPVSTQDHDSRNPKHTTVEK